MARWNAKEKEWEIDPHEEYGKQGEKQEHRIYTRDGATYRQERDALHKAVTDDYQLKESWGATQKGRK